MTIELRLTDIDPPAPEPKRTIYRDIVNLPDPVKLGMTIRYFNHDDVALYMQITGSGPGYTFGTVNLGSLASGANAYTTLDEFVSRAKPGVGDLPGGEMTENITLILKAYTDSGYTDLKWTYERTVTVYWINSVDAAFTEDALNNFDDGTVQTWAVASEVGGTDPTVAAVTDYVLSAPYSCQMKTGQRDTATEIRTRLYKSFTTANKDKVFAILDIRAGREGTGETYVWMKYHKIQRNTTLLTFLGKDVNEEVHHFPMNKWMRIVVPLPKNATVEVQIVLSVYYYPLTSGYLGGGLLWLDDFKIVSK